MNRRTFLASVGAGVGTGAGISLAGCLGAPDTSGSPSSSNNSTATSYQMTDFSTAATQVAPTYQWLVQIAETASAEAVEQEQPNATVLDVSEIGDEDVRAVVKQTIREGDVKTAEIPDGLRSLVDRVDFFTWDARTDTEDTHAHWRLESYDARPNRSPVTFDAQVRDARVSSDDPGAIEFSLTNEGDRSYEIFSGTVPPFGLLWAAPQNGHDKFLLWRDYTEEGCVTINDERGVVVCDIGKATPIQPGETISRTYQVHPGKPKSAGIRAGEFVVAETLSYHPEPRGPRHEVEWEVTFALETTRSPETA